MCDTNYSHCEHMCLCYIMLWIHSLNISSQGRRKSRWNRWIAEQNPGGVKGGALYGRENTCKVNQYNLFIWQPHFIKFGINVPFKPSWIVLWRAVSVLSVNVYEHKNISPPQIWRSSTLLKHQTVQIHSSDLKANKTLLHDIVTIVSLKMCECLMDIWEGTALSIEIFYWKT